ncbi:MAG: AAA family ATPase [Sulfurimonas sp.]|nr:AAA family ATPase [Sulfurimonas sp.]
MELVYLWVDEYKNIKNQGFNFSPRFTCKYEDGKLTIDKKEHVSIFPDNINVTAIVGENGSGKSSIYKLILMLIYYHYFRYLVDADKFLSHEDQKNYHGKKKIEKKFKDKLFLVICANNKLQTINIGDAIPNNIPKLGEITFFSTYLNYMMDTLWDDYDDDWTNHVYHKTDNYSTPLLIQPDKKMGQISLHNLEYLTKQKIFQFNNELNSNINITNFFKPNFIRLVDRLIHDMRINNSMPPSHPLSIMKKIDDKILHVVQVKWGFKTKTDFIYEKIKEIENSKDYEYINLLYIAFKAIDSNRLYFDEILYQQLENDTKKFIQKNSLPSKEYLNSFEFSKIIIDDSKNYNILKLKTSLDFHKNKIYNNEKFKNLFNGEKHTIRSLKDILIYIPAWIDIEFFENEKSFESLSSGEKSLFRLILDLMYQLNNIIKEYDTVNFLLDETELGLHPNWQKRYLNDLLKSLQPILEANKKKRINILFATHSPFILSDLPKENVIFLEKGKQVDVKVDTFGANIHTLLADGFFMKDGLMGEFAKGKIEDVINYLNDKESTIKDNDEAQKLLNIIGEPIIKNQLQRMLDSKRLSKVDEIDKIKSDMENLAKRLQELEK